MKNVIKCGLYREYAYLIFRIVVDNSTAHIGTFCGFVGKNMFLADKGRGNWNPKCFPIVCIVKWWVNITMGDLAMGTRRFPIENKTVSFDNPLN